MILTLKQLLKQTLKISQNRIKTTLLEGWTNKAIQAANLWQTATYSSDKYIKATPL